jgi:phage gpG-like protein
MRDAGRLAWASVMENFDSGGRPTGWAAKKTGEPSYLYQSGHLRSSIDWRSDKDSFTVSVSSAQVPYAFAMHFGYAARNIRPRQYMMFQKEDEELIQSMFADELVKLFKTKRRPVGTQS